MSVKSDFEKEFYDEEYEMLVLMQSNCNGGAIIGDMLKPSVEFLASVDLRTNTVSQEKGRLEWLIKDSKHRKGWGFDLKQFGIYHILVRRCIPKQLLSYQSQVMNNRYMLVKVLKENASNETLEALKDYYQKPVSIVNGLGEFVLDREYSWFKGKLDWNGVNAKIYLETDQEDGDSANKAMAKLLDLAKDIAGNDAMFRKYAAKELTELANDWLESSDEEESAEITEESFAQRISIDSITIYPDGELTIYYYDDDMFWGHSVEIVVNADGELESADMVG